MLNSVSFLRPLRLKTMEEAHFIEKINIENIIDELVSTSQDAYSASLPLIASALLGNNKQYEIAYKQLRELLLNLEKCSDAADSSNSANSFKAWMWGRILLAADSIDDRNGATEALEKLQLLLSKNTNDNHAFFTWAWAYRAAYDHHEYDIAKKRMLDEALLLNDQFKKSKEQGASSALSDALWAWVMNLQAAAYAGDKTTYQWIKEQIQFVTETESTTQGLVKGLLRTTQSNDYPAWAMAKVRYAASVAGDNELYREIESPLTLSMDEAQKANAKAEYVLSFLENQLAMNANKNNK